MTLKVVPPFDACTQCAVLDRSMPHLHDVLVTAAIPRPARCVASWLFLIYRILEVL